MGRNIAALLCIGLLVGTVIAVDLLFFKNQTSARLMANAGIVLVFLAFYWRVLRRP